MGNNLITLMSDERMAVLCNEIDTWAAEKAKEDSAEVRWAQDRRDDRILFRIYVYPLG